MTFRVKACNKAVAGEFSEPVTLETHGKSAVNASALLLAVTGRVGVSQLWLIFSVQLQTGLLVIPPEPEGGGHECGVGRQRGETTGHPQREEQNQLPNALPSQVCAVGKVEEIQLGKNEKKISRNVPFRSALMSPKRAPTARPGRDRFTAESYTVLGESSPPHKQHLKDQKHHLKQNTHSSFPFSIQPRNSLHSV